MKTPARPAPLPWYKKVITVALYVFLVITFGIVAAKILYEYGRFIWKLW